MLMADGNLAHTYSPLMRLVNQRCHDSILLALQAVCGDHTCVHYSNKGRTNVMNALVKVSGSLETKVRSIKEARI